MPDSPLSDRAARTAWKPGDVALLQWRLGGQVRRIYPVIVVEDSPGLVALYLPAGTPIKLPVGPNGEPISRALSFVERFALPWRLGDGMWSGNSVLQLAQPGEARSTWGFWSGEHEEFRTWYVNLQAPLVRTRIGFDTEDHVLDLVVDRELNWRWKDEDELDEAVRVGRFTEEQATAISSFVFSSSAPPEA